MAATVPASCITAIVVLFQNDEADRTETGSTSNKRGLLRFVSWGLAIK
jgi:hypothetical protein